MPTRQGEVHRKTRETDILIQVKIDGRGVASIRTGIAFLDHMLELLGRHGLLDLHIQAQGDLTVDHHHTVEDLGLTLGSALDQALGDRQGIGRYGWAMVPMDDALSRVAVDLGGRPWLVWRVSLRHRRIRNFDLRLVREFFQALVVQARMNLHIEVPYGEEPHHTYEAIFKGVGRALRQACARDPRERGVPSTKGVL